MAASIVPAGRSAASAVQSVAIVSAAGWPPAEWPATQNLSRGQPRSRASRQRCATARRTRGAIRERRTDGQSGSLTRATSTPASLKGRAGAE